MVFNLDLKLSTDNKRNNQPEKFATHTLLDGLVCLNILHLEVNGNWKLYGYLLTREKTILVDADGNDGLSSKIVENMA